MPHCGAQKTKSDVKQMQPQGKAQLSVIDLVTTDENKKFAPAGRMASAIVDRGTMSALVSNLLGLDVARSLGLLISGDEKIPLRCMVTDFEIRDGKMQPRIFVLDTANTMVLGTGTIDLGKERLDLELRGKQKRPSPLSLGGPITVGGTFKSPEIGLGAETYVRGGAAIALGALLTPLASILGFIDSGKDQDTDCRSLEADATDASAKKPPRAGTGTSK